MPDILKKNQFELSFVLICTVFLLCMVPFLYRNGIWVNDEGNRMLAIQAYAENSEGILPDPFRGQEPRPGIRGYPEPYFYNIDCAGQQFRSGYSPAFPRMMSVLYMFRGFTAVRVWVIWAALFSVLLTGLCVREFNLRTSYAIFAMVLTAFATPLLFYSGTVLELTSAVLLACSMWLFLLRSLNSGEDRTKGLVRICISGILGGMIPYFREEGYVLCAAICVGLLFLRERRRFLVFALAAFTAILPYWIYNLYDSGSVFGMHYRIYADLPGTSPWGVTRFLSAVWVFLFKGNLPTPAGIFYAIVFAIMLLFGFLPDRGVFFMRLKGAALLCGAATAFLNFRDLLNWSEPCGFMLACQSLAGTVPFAILPFFFGRTLIHQRNHKLLFIILCFASVGIAASLDPKQTGIFFSARHFMTILPLAACLTALLLYHFRFRKIFRILIFAFAVISIACQLQGLRLLNLRKSYSADLVSFTANNSSPLILTDVFWMPEELAVVAPHKQIFYLTGPRGFVSALRFAEKNNISNIVMLVSPSFSNVPDSVVNRAAAYYDIHVLHTFNQPKLQMFRIQAWEFVRKPH